MRRFGDIADSAQWLRVVEYQAGGIGLAALGRNPCSRLPGSFSKETAARERRKPDLTPTRIRTLV